MYWESILQHRSASSLLQDIFKAKSARVFSTKVSDQLFSVQTKIKLMYQQNTASEGAVLLRFGAQDECSWCRYRQVSDKQILCVCEMKCWNHPYACYMQLARSA